MNDELSRNIIIPSINPKLNNEQNIIIQNFSLFSIRGIAHICKSLSLLSWCFVRAFFSKIYTKKKKIRNQVILITGSGGFLGRQLACEFSKHGCSLVLWDINEEENQKTYDALRALGHRRVYLHKVDLTNENDIRENAKIVLEKHGHVSMIVLAAATVCDVKSILLKSKEELERSFSLFYLSHVWIYQMFLPNMIEKNDGHIVCISSDCVIKDRPITITYGSMKAAQTKLLEGVDSELNSNELNQIKTSIVFLGGLKGGLSVEFAKCYNVDESIIRKRGIDTDKTVKTIINEVLKNRKYIYVPNQVYWTQLLKCVLPTICYEFMFSPNSYLRTGFITIKKKD